MDIGGSLFNSGFLGADFFWWVGQIADARIWLTEPPQAIPVTVPVTVLAGTPIVNMPGCVKVHKENAKERNHIMTLG